MNAEIEGSVSSAPMKVSLTALALTALVLLVVAWSAAVSIKQAEEVNRRNGRIEGLRGTIGRLDEALTMSARMGAVTGDPQWEGRYRSVEPQLESAIQQALSLVPHTGAAEAVAQIGAANTALVEMANKAFDLTRQGHPEAARAALFSGAYDEQKRVYAAGLDRLDEGLAESARRALEGQRRRVRMVLITSAVAMSLLVLCWLVAVRTMNRGNAALVRSQERLSRQSAELARLNAEGDRETQLGASEGRLRAILDAALDAVIGMDADGAITYWNPRAEAIFGWGHEEALGRRLADLVIPERYREAHSRGLARFLATGEGPVLDKRIEMEGLRRDGAEFPIELSITAVKQGETHSFSAFLADMTEQRRLEAQLRHAQKMEAIGRLAGGVAHDFNNSLGVILGYAELLMRGAAEAQRPKLDHILKATQRASALTSQLLVFSRRQAGDPRVLSLNSLLSEVEKMLRRLIGEHIELAIVPSADLGQVTADPGQVEQVVMNLCLNARDAMKDGGRLLIETRNAEMDAAFAARHDPMAAGRYVMLAVSDTGSGIDKETQAKIFEPFFTTKEVGKDTGLGLAIVYGIVKQAGGFVWVYSEVGHGTTFKIYLPRVDEPAVAAAAEGAPISSKGWETILVVEDEPALRAMTHEILEGYGYRVIEATGPKEAIEIAQRHPEPIHLLLTDVVMPGMNGRALAETLVAARPALRVLYMSGYTDEVIAHSGVLAPGVLLLEKPFTVLALLRRVRLALGERDGQAKV